MESEKVRLKSKDISEVHVKVNQDDEEHDCFVALSCDAAESKQKL